jgi:hypothetical protein
MSVFANGTLGVCGFSQAAKHHRQLSNMKKYRMENVNFLDQYGK